MHSYAPIISIYIISFTYGCISGGNARDLVHSVIAAAFMGTIIVASMYYFLMGIQLHPEIMAIAAVLIVCMVVMGNWMVQQACPYLVGRHLGK